MWRKSKTVYLTINQVTGRIQPMKRKRTKTKLTDQLRWAIDHGDKTRYQIAKETENDEATLSRLMHGKGGLSMDGLDRIAECLDLNLTAGDKPHKAKGK